MRTDFTIRKKIYIYIFKIKNNEVLVHVYQRQSFSGKIYDSDREAKSFEKQAHSTTSRDGTNLTLNRAF